MTYALSPRRTPRPAGFSLVEAMLVVVMVSVLVTLAIPTISWQLKSRRTSQAAGQVAQVFSNARALAMGRGSAVLVAFYTGPSGRGVLDVRAAAASNTNVGYCGVAAYAQCTTADWSQAVNTGTTTVTSTARYRPLPLLGFDPSMNTLFGTSAITAQVIQTWNSQTNYSAATTLDLCFTPMGRTWLRSPGVMTAQGTINGTPGAWVQSQQVVQFQIGGDQGAVSNGAGTGSFGFTRTVLVPPNGNARQGA